MGSILIAAAERGSLGGLRKALSLLGHDLTVVDSADKALDRVGQTEFDLVVLDLLVPCDSRMALAAELRQRSQRPDLPMVVLTLGENRDDEGNGSPNEIVMDRRRGSCGVAEAVAHLLPTEGPLCCHERKGRDGRNPRYVPTTCPYCGVGCGMYLNVRDGRLVGTLASPRHVVSRGRLCIKGWTAHEPIMHRDRLTDPLIRRDGELQPATWDEALDLCARRFREIKSAHGSDALGVFGSARCTNEENYLAQRLARAVFGTNNVDHCARTCHSPTVAGLVRSFGSGAMTNSIEEIASASCLFVIGSNVTEAHPIIGWRVRRALDHKARLVVADPRRTEAAQWADLYLAHRPGTDIALLNAMANVILSEGFQDQDFIDERTEGFEEFRAAVERYTPERAGEVCGLDPDLIREAARLYALSKPAAILYTLGITEHTVGTANVMAIANLALITGNVGKSSSGVNPLRGQNNVQGACDMAALPNYFPGYQPLDDAAVRAKFQKAWGALPPAKPGLTLTDMLIAAGEGRVKGLYIVGEDPVRSDPNSALVERHVRNLDFLVCQEIFLNETCRLADVVLPAASFAEKDGTFTNSERRVQRVRAAIAPLGNARPDWQIICDLSARMGHPMNFRDPSQVLDEIASLAPIYGGIHFDRIEQTGLQWPCPDRSHPGTVFLHEGTFKRGRGRFHPLEHRPPAETPDDEYPLILSTGRILVHYNVGTMTRRTMALDRECPRNFCMINPQDAERFGVRPSGLVRVATRRGELVVDAQVTDRVRPGVIWMPFHFTESPANLLTNDAFCPIARTGEYKACAARIEAATRPVEEVSR